MDDLESQVPTVEVDVVIESESESDVDIVVELTVDEPFDPHLDLETLEHKSALDILRFPYYCGICLSQYEINDSEGNPFTLSCGHTFCKTCLFRYLESKILDGEITPYCFNAVDVANPCDDDNDDVENHHQQIAITTENTPVQDMVFSILPASRSGKEDDHQLFTSKKYQVIDEKANTSTNDIIGVANDSYIIYMKNDDNNNEQQQQQQQLIEPITPKECGIVFTQEDIHILIQHDTKLANQYKRFKFFQDNKKNGRECPNTSCGELLIGFPEAPAMICTKCQASFCFHHSLAHPSNIPCEEYIKSQAGETALNDAYLANTTKPCPNCGNLITKISGCNHMKCRCGTAFCWICGKAVADETFPVHFQWWNVNGCTNMQMVNDLSTAPPRHIVYFARLRSFIELIIFGPITLLSAILSMLFCPCCVFRNKKRSFAETLGGLMTWWGMVYMILLIGLPIGLVIGSVILVWVIVYSILYVIYRLLTKQYPWPDAWGQNVMFLIRTFQEPTVPPLSPAPMTTVTLEAASVSRRARRNRNRENNTNNNNNTDSNITDNTTTNDGIDSSLSLRQQRRHRKRQKKQQQQPLSVSMTIPPPTPTTVSVYSSTQLPEEDRRKIQAAVTAKKMMRENIDIMEKNNNKERKDDGDDDEYDDDDDEYDDSKDLKNTANNISNRKKNKIKKKSTTMKGKKKLHISKQQQQQQQQQHDTMMMTELSADNDDNDDHFSLSNLFRHHHEQKDDEEEEDQNYSCGNIHDDIIGIDAHMLTKSKAASSSLPVTVARVISEHVLLTLSEERVQQNNNNDEDNSDNHHSFFALQNNNHSRSSSNNSHNTTTTPSPKETRPTSFRQLSFKLSQSS